MKYSVPLILNLMFASFQVVAQQPADSQTNHQQFEHKTSTADFELLDEVSQPPAETSSITVIVEKKQTIEEYRQNGELVLIKVIPNDGIPYFIDPLERENLNGFGRDIINSGVKPVRWVVKEF